MAKKSKYPLVYFIIAVGGNLKKPSVERMEITKEEIDDYLDGSEETEEEAINYFLEEECNGWGQRWCPAIAVSEKEFGGLVKEINKLTP